MYINIPFSETNKLLGKRLTELRCSAGYNQIEAAEKLGITQSSLSLFESGKRSVSLDILLHILNLYNADYSDIFNELSTKPVTSTEKCSTAQSILTELIQTTQSDEICSAVNAYTFLCIYKMFREIYECNPHNTSSIFSVSKDKAFELTDNFIKKELSIVSSIIRAGTYINRTQIELPVEKSAQLNNFIRTCEKILLENNSNCFI